MCYNVFKIVNDIVRLDAILAAAIMLSCFTDLETSMRA